MGESPDLCSAPVQDVVGVGFRVAATVVSDATATAETIAPAPAIFSPAATMPSNGGQGRMGSAALLGFDENEVRSSPQEPYVGMEFDTVEGAKAPT